MLVAGVAAFERHDDPDQASGPAAAAEAPLAGSMRADPRPRFNGTNTAFVLTGAARNGLLAGPGAPDSARGYRCPGDDIPKGGVTAEDRCGPALRPAI